MSSIYIAILFVFLTFCGCRSGSVGTDSYSSNLQGKVSNAKTDTTMVVISKYEDLQEHKGQEVILEGIMVMEKFVNKAGREYDFYEFWLEMNDEHSIMLRNVGEAISKEPFTHKVHIRGKLFYGNIDSDNPEAQSRVGYRLDFTKVTIVERR